MTRSMTRAWIAGLAMAAFAPAIAAAAAPPVTTPISRGETAYMARFYAGRTEKVGRFPGRLVCLRCDMAPGGSAAVCAKEGHRHALAMDGDTMIHPLLPATDDVLRAINAPENHGKHVTVQGIYYSQTGAIFVNALDVGN